METFSPEIFYPEKMHPINGKNQVEHTHIQTTDTSLAAKIGHEWIELVKPVSGIVGKFQRKLVSSTINVFFG